MSLIPADLADLIRDNHQMAYDYALVKDFRERINGGDPWPLIEEAKGINQEISKVRLFDLIGVKPKAQAVGLGLTATCAAHITPEDISWLWPDRIALGKLTLIAGDPGLGKSMLTCALAAHVTMAESWPVDRSPCPLGAVIMASAEDDMSDTIRPRLDAAGADPNKVFILNIINELDVDTGETFKRAFSIERDIHLPEQLVEKHPDCKLITIDPISAYLGKVDSHNNAEIRAVLAPLADLAQKYRVAVLGITHFNKSGSSAMYRAMGSLAFVAAARAAYAVTKDQDNPERRLFLPLKNNLGDDTTGFSYTILTTGNGTPYVAWDTEQITVSADEALAPGNDEDAPALRDAEEWLLEELSHGPVKTKDLQKLARDSGISWRTIRRAKDEIGAEVKKRRFDGFWEWSLPFNPEILSAKVAIHPSLDKMDTFVDNMEGDHEGGHVGQGSVYGHLRGVDLHGFTLEQLQTEANPDEWNEIQGNPEAVECFARSLREDRQ